MQESLLRYAAGESAPSGMFRWGVHEGIRGAVFITVTTDGAVRRGAETLGAVPSVRVRALAALVAPLLALVDPPQSPARLVTIDVLLDAHRATRSFSPAAPEIAAAAALFAELAAQARP